MKKNKDIDKEKASKWRIKQRIDLCRVLDWRDE